MAKSAVEAVAAEPSMASQAAALLPLVYDELCSLSRARLARLGAAPQLSPMELVHEAYLRVANGRGDGLAGRQHFFFAVSRAMHDILVESARRKASKKRGGDYVVVSGVPDELAVEGSPEQMLELDLALQKLERKSAESAQVVLLGYFGGLTQPQIAEVLGLSLATVERRWAFSRAWLARELSRPDLPRPDSQRRRRVEPGA